MKPAVKQLRTWLKWGVSLWLVLQLTACITYPALQGDLRPKTWAQPLLQASEGQSVLDNAYQVSPVLYRSAQPSTLALQMLNLEPERVVQMYRLPRPIKTVVSLRNNAGDGAVFPASTLLYVQIPIDTWSVHHADVVTFLRTVRQAENQPVLVHCYHGSDRTGLMVAMYRIVEQGWSKQEAIAEMKQGGFGYHPMWFNLIRYIEHVDVEAMRREVQAKTPKIEI